MYLFPCLCCFGGAKLFSKEDFSLALIKSRASNVGSLFSVQGGILSFRNIR